MYDELHSSAASGMDKLGIFSTPNLDRRLSELFFSHSWGLFHSKVSVKAQVPRYDLQVSCPR